jgi:hypothetical protein
MKKHNYLIIVCILFFTACSNSDDDLNNTAPGNFAANTTETRFNGATIEWTESNDPDGDEVTYAIILDGQEITSGGTTLTYSFSGLEPDTSYEGYVEARDGNGGTSKAPYFFTTEPQVIIMDLDIQYRWWTAPGEFAMMDYFEVIAVEDAISYQVEVLEYAPDVIPSNVGRTYSWTPDSNLPTGNNVGTGAGVLVEFTPGVYHCTLSVVGATIDQFDVSQNLYEAQIGTARLTVILGEQD